MLADHLTGRFGVLFIKLGQGFGQFVAQTPVDLYNLTPGPQPVFNICALQRVF